MLLKVMAYSKVKIMNKPAVIKSDIATGTTREATVKVLGGSYPVKTVEQASKAIDPSNRKKAPGSVRV
jgi:hypothetical protein